MALYRFQPGNPLRQGSSAPMGAGENLVAGGVYEIDPAYARALCEDIPGLDGGSCLIPAPAPDRHPAAPAPTSDTPPAAASAPVAEPVKRKPGRAARS